MEHSFVNITLNSKETLLDPNKLHECSPQSHRTLINSTEVISIPPFTVPTTSTVDFPIQTDALLVASFSLPSQGVLDLPLLKIDATIRAFRQNLFGSSIKVHPPASVSPDS